MIDAETLTEARRVIDRARVIAEAPAAGVGAIGSGHPSGKAPPGAWAHNASTLDTFGARINDAIATGDPDEVWLAIGRCEKELHAIQHSPAVGAETPAQFKWRINNEYEGVPAPVVARKERTSVTTVRKFRSEDGREPRLGRKVDDPELRE